MVNIWAYLNKTDWINKIVIISNLRGGKEKLNYWIERAYKLGMMLFWVKVFYGLHIILKEDKDTNFREEIKMAE